MIKKYVIDRIEDEYAYCESESGSIESISRTLLPNNVCEGDVVIYDDGSWSIDHDETLARRCEVRKKMDRLFKRRKSGKE